MFVDASAIIAILTFEPEKPVFSKRLEASRKSFVSPLVIYEATLGLRRKVDCSIAQARVTVMRFVEETQSEVMIIDAQIGDLALDAHDRFGKGRHKAALNMGDCFSYACAKARNSSLLFKGDDFIHTDIVVA